MAKKFEYKNHPKFDNVVSDAFNEYGVDVKLYKDDKFILTNNLILHDPNATLNDLKIFETVYQCCWDSSLFMIQDCHIIEKIKASKFKVKDFEQNELSFADTEEGDTGESTSTSNGIAEREGTGVKFGSKEEWKPISCRKQKKQSIVKNKDKIQIGIVDFGFGDPHADTIKSIIKTGDRFEIHDYNLVASFPVANTLAICCQIKRAIESGIDILNLSVGYYSIKANPLIKKYILEAQKAKILIICSAGNSDNNNSVSPHWPSNFSELKNICNVICVSASQRDPEDPPFKKTDYANYGKKNVQVYCRGTFPYPPNVNVYKQFTFPWGPLDSPISVSYRLHNAIGTSFATPYITSKIAKLFDNNTKENYIVGGRFDVARILDEIGVADQAGTKYMPN